MNQPTNGIYKPPRRRKISKVGIGCSHLISILRTGATGNPITSPIDQATVDDARKNANKFQMKFVKYKRGENTNKVKKKAKKNKNEKMRRVQFEVEHIGQEIFEKRGKRKEVLTNYYTQEIIQAAAVNVLMNRLKLRQVCK